MSLHVGTFCQHRLNLKIATVAINCNIMVKIKLNLRHPKMHIAYECQPHCSITFFPEISVEA